MTCAICLPYVIVQVFVSAKAIAAGLGTSCVQFACSLCVCLTSLHVVSVPPTLQRQTCWANWNFQKVCISVCESKQVSAFYVAVR